MDAQRKDDREFKLLEQERDAERDKSRKISMMQAYVTSETCSESVKEKINQKLNSYYSNMASTLDLSPILAITAPLPVMTTLIPEKKKFASALDTSSDEEEDHGASYSMISNMTEAGKIVQSKMSLDEQYRLNMQLQQQRNLRQSAIENKNDSDELTQV